MTDKPTVMDSLPCPICQSVNVIVADWGFHVKCLDCGCMAPPETWNARHRAQQTARSGDVNGWIVGGPGSNKWRIWTALGPDWTDDRDKATRYARREDAEQVHAEDDDAWRVEPYIAALTTPPADDGGLRDALAKAAAENWRVPNHRDPAKVTEMVPPKDDCVWGYEQGYLAALSDHPRRDGDAK